MCFIVTYDITTNYNIPSDGLATLSNIRIATDCCCECLNHTQDILLPLTYRITAHPYNILLKSGRNFILGLVKLTSSPYLKTY